MISRQEFNINYYRRRIDFGNKTITASVIKNGVEKFSKSEVIQVFFPLKAKNHPGTRIHVDENGTTVGKSPNWFYYWSGTAVTGYDRNNSKHHYGGNGGSGNFGSITLYSAGDYRRHTEYKGLYLYDAACGSEKYKTTYNGNVILDIDRKGIDTSSATVVHELTHWYVFRDRYSNPKSGIWQGSSNSDDPDNDFLPNSWEDANSNLGFDKNNEFSFPKSTTSFPYGNDFEVYCELQAKDSKGDATKDWSQGGKQW